MATYYTSSSNQVDDMPGNAQRDSSGAYPEGQVLSNNMMYLHPSNVAASYSDSMPESYQLQLNGGEHPSIGVSQSTPNRGNLSDLIGSHIREPPYDVWRDGRNEFSFMHPMNGSTTIQSIGKQIEEKTNLASNSVCTEDPEMGASMESLQRGQNLQGQGLSLSLSTRIPTAVPVSLFQYQNPNLGLSSFFNSYPSTSGDGSNGEGSRRNDVMTQSGFPGNVGYFSTGVPRENHNEIKGETDLNMHSNRLSSLSSIIPNSRYLKVAQQLLDEVVDVRKALKQESNKQQSSGSGLKVSKDADGKPKEDSGLAQTTRVLQSSDESNANPAGELSPGNSQDLQNKITELLSMLNEVDRRYKQYYHQMQIVASYFDGIAGSGASKPYTTLALQTISRHFRCIRDAISGQIKATRSSLGEDDTGNTREGGISRLRFVEQKLRQHRALQQLGMMQQHAWRPQRGLPETSVTILRAWLFEHFLHPYPKDSDKILLSRQTGLTRGQVSNWFINARVRLWKPMIEDMYKEEIGDSELDSNSSSDYALKAANNKNKVSEDMGEASKKNMYSETTEKRHIDQYHESKCDFTRDVEMSQHASGNCFQDDGHGQIETAYGGTKIMGEPRSDMVSCRVSQDTLFQSDGNSDGRFITASTAYQMAELEMFGSQGGISLTLGLQHFDGSISDAAHHNFGAMRGTDLYNPVTSVEPNNADMDCIDPDNQQYRFGNSHLLHDFVAQ